jgi:hypothetical protein
VSDEPRLATVPLEAGLGPDNPPCPACGEPLFGWTRAPGGTPVRRCERCGLAVVGDPGDAGEALAALEQDRVDRGRYRVANRASLAAWLGGGAWAALEPNSRYLFSADAVRRLLGVRGRRVERVRWRPAAGVLITWATLLNSFTWGHDVALAALGRAASTPARRPWQRGLDRFISVVASPVVLLAALLLEAGGGLAGRGAMIELTVSPR